MPTYTVSLKEDGRGVSREVVFEAQDAGRALFIVQQLNTGRRVVLSEGSTPLCQLERRATRGGSDVWVVLPLVGAT